MNVLPTRKPNRLKDYDYSSNGAYFITVCTKEKQCILSEVIVGTSIARPPEIALTRIGAVVDSAIRAIPEHYKNVKVDNYVVMPNHIHLLIRMEGDNNPTISRIIQHMKGYVTKQVGHSIWQDKSYDHVIRDENDYLIRWQYIDNNPISWLLKQDEDY